MRDPLQSSMDDDKCCQGFVSEASCLHSSPTVSQRAKPADNGPVSAFFTPSMGCISLLVEHGKD